jgi:hypothetical protein
MFRENDGSDGRVVVSEEARQLRELAAAIRRGCAIQPRQAFNNYERKKGGIVVAVCVMRAAQLGGRQGGDFGPYFRSAADCPARHECNDEYFRSTRWGIVHLNDVHLWSREAIADWLMDEAARR